MVELSCLKAQEALALAGLISDAARQFIEQLPAVEVLMPKLSFAEINGAARLNAARWLKPLSLAKIYLLTPRPSMPPATFIARGDKPGGDTVDFCWLFRAGLLRRIDGALAAARRGN
jgi:hypothetical protein